MKALFYILFSPLIFVFAFIRIIACIPIMAGILCAGIIRDTQNEDKLTNLMLKISPIKDVD